MRAREAQNDLLSAANISLVGYSKFRPANTSGDACGLFITVRRLARKAKVSRLAAEEPVS